MRKILLNLQKCETRSKMSQNSQKKAKFNGFRGSLKTVIQSDKWCDTVIFGLISQLYLCHIIRHYWLELIFSSSRSKFMRMEVNSLVRSSNSGREVLINAYQTSTGTKKKMSFNRQSGTFAPKLGANAWIARVREKVHEKIRLEYISNHRNEWWW